MARNPETPEDWAAAVDAAVGLMAFDEARRRGFLEGGPGINSQRCYEFAIEGAKLGHRATREGVGYAAMGIAEEMGAPGEAETIRDVVLHVYDEAIRKADAKAAEEGGFGITAIRNIGQIKGDG